MVRKRKKVESEKPWCFYCDREFQDEKDLVTHQKGKHFRCVQCGKRLASSRALTVHSLQLHKVAITEIPDAKPGREDPSREIFGSQGIPPGMKRGGDPPPVGTSVPNPAVRPRLSGAPVRPRPVSLPYAPTPAAMGRGYPPSTIPPAYRPPVARPGYPAPVPPPVRVPPPLVPAAHARHAAPNMSYRAPPPYARPHHYAARPVPAGQHPPRMHVPPMTQIVGAPLKSHTQENVQQQSVPTRESDQNVQTQK